MKKILSIIVLLLIIGIIIFFVYFNKSKEVVIDTSPNKAVDMSFQFDKDDIFSVRYPYESESLFEITQNISQEQGWDFYFDDYGDMGILVKQIKDKKNGEEQKYWQYFINNEQPQISVNNYYPNNEENITWKFIESEF